MCANICQSGLSLLLILPPLEANAETKLTRPILGGRDHASVSASGFAAEDDEAGRTERHSATLIALANSKASMATESRQIIYASAPTPVSMTDYWFDIANLDHFWVRRRFDVFKRMAGALIQGADQVVEIGCGNGLVQRGVEDCYGIPVAGFDLTEHALERNISRSSPLYYYDIHQRAPEFRARFDIVLLMDVLEHIADQAAFLQSIKYHMTVDGALVVNVPAHQFLYSHYDHSVGHYRRYSVRSLKEVAEQNGFFMHSFSYWGAPLLPLLLLRKAVVRLHRSERSVVSSGFDPGSRLMNLLCGILANCEMIPQSLGGTSLIAVLKVAGGANECRS